MKKFLIISVNAIGDTYLSLSGADKIKDIFPNSEIDFVINSNSNFLLSEIKFINKIIINKSLINTFNTLFEINQKHYDYVFNFFPGRLNTIFNILASAKIKVGYWNILPLLDWSSTNQIIHSNLPIGKTLIWEKEYNYLERIDLVLQSININSPLKSKLTFSFDNIYPFHFKDYFLLHTSSRIRSRSLNNKNVEALVNYILKKFDNKIIFICSDDDNNFKFIKSLESEKVKIFVNPILPDLIQTIKFSKLFFAVDSFPIHLADAYNSSFFGLFGPTNPSSVLLNVSKSIKFNVDSLQDISEEIFLKAIENKIIEDNLI